MGILETVTAVRTAMATLEESRARRAEELEALRRQHGEADANDAAAVAVLWRNAVDAILDDLEATFPEYTPYRDLTRGPLGAVAVNVGNIVTVRFMPAPTSVDDDPSTARPAIIAEIDRSAAGYGNSVAEALRDLVTELRKDGRFAPCKALLNLYESRVSHE